MKENKLKVIINKPANEIFTFTLNPKNTPLWIEAITKEEVNESPTKLGTIYRNANKKNDWSQYSVTSFEKNKLFVFTSENNNYHCKYTLRPIDRNITELEYYEWVDKGRLNDPFTLKILEKLKTVLEKF